MVGMADALDLSRLGLGMGNGTELNAAPASNTASPGVVNITVPLGADGDFKTTLSHLFGSNAQADIWGNDITNPLDKTTTRDDSAQGENAVPGVTSIPGVFTQDWLNAHLWDLILGAIVLILVLYGIHAATSH